ncbi:MAG: DUF799 domain-containing protein [Microvirgula sp.]
MIARRIGTVLVGLMLAVSSLAARAEDADKPSAEKLREAKLRSVLVVPVVNRSVDVDAQDYFLTTISRPLAERGYYVFPVHLVKRMMEDEGMADADMVHGADPRQLAGLFGADSVLYISIERWDARYIVLSTTVTVALDYTLKSGLTGETLWKSHQQLAYSPQNNNSSGNPLVDLVAMAVTAAIAKASPNYMPLAQRANQQAVYTGGLLPGPYDLPAEK